MKKLAIFILIAVLAIALTVPALANDANVSVRMNGNGNNARLEITVNGEMQSFANPGNATRVFEVNGFRIEVVTQGNSVRSFKNLGAIPAAVVAPAPAAVAPAAAPVQAAAPVAGQTHRVNVGFHCNDIEGGGNGRVWTGYEGQQTLTRSDERQPNGNAIWTLNGPVCTCGRTDWVNFSNNSGVPNGNNIQLNHAGPSRRNITVTVTYTIFIPECKDITCDAVCNEVECENDYTCKEADNDYCVDPSVCIAECLFAECEDCPEHECKICKCAVNARQVVVTEKRLITFAENTAGRPVEGFAFSHDAPATWRGGATANVSSRFINETLFNSKAYTINYRGAGDCTPCDYACEWEAPDCAKCECVACVPYKCELDCECACEGGPCDKKYDGCECECYIPPVVECEHEIVCDDCNGHGDCTIGDFECPECEFCRPCICDDDDTPPPCTHRWACPNCIGKGNDQGNQGHENCVVACYHANGNTKFDCLDCDAVLHSNDTSHDIYCECPLPDCGPTIEPTNKPEEPAVESLTTPLSEEPEPESEPELELQPEPEVEAELEPELEDEE